MLLPACEVVDSLGQYDLVALTSAMVEQLKSKCKYEYSI